MPANVWNPDDLAQPLLSAVEDTGFQEQVPDDLVLVFDHVLALGELILDGGGQTGLYFHGIRQTLKGKRVMIYEEFKVERKCERLDFREICLALKYNFLTNIYFARFLK